MEFRELSDEEWGIIKPLLPPKASVGRPRIDDRLVVNGILYVLVTGCRWMDLPAKYGSYKTCWDRFKKWSVRGVWSKILEALIAIGYSTGKLSLDKVAVDSITVKAGRGLVGYDGYWRVKVMKIHVAVTKESHKPGCWA